MFPGSTLTEETTNIKNSESSAVELTTEQNLVTTTEPDLTTKSTISIESNEKSDEDNSSESSNESSEETKESQSESQSEESNESDEIFEKYLQKAYLFPLQKTFFEILGKYEHRNLYLKVTTRY